MHRLNGLIKLFTQPTPAHLVVALFLLAVVVSTVWVGHRVSVTTLLACGVAAEAFSGNWKFTPIPLPLDRLLLLSGALLLLLRGPATVSNRKVLLRPTHFVLLALAGYTTANALWFGSLSGTYGLYALLDRLGIVPFLMYTLAPVVFGTRKQRDVLLRAMVGLGVYLGLDGLAEGLGVRSIVFPSFINDQNIGITQGRVRGPFLAADAMGFALFACAVFAVIGLREWRGYWSRRACYLVIALSIPGVFLTLTRSVWIGAVAAAVVTLVAHPRLRRWLPAATVAGLVVVVGSLAVVPGLSAKVHDRVSTQSSVWDRYNTNNAALRALAAHPAFGIGWQEFETKSFPYFRQASTYPLTGVGLEVHNVFLSHFAELGIIGGLLAILAFTWVIGTAILRRGPPDLEPFRYGALAIAVMFVVVGNLGPLSYALPNMLLWLSAGIAASHYNSEPRRREAPATAAVAVLNASG